MSQTIAPPDLQESLFYVPVVINCDSAASARNAYGNAAQEIVYTLLDIRRIPINGTYTTCFDGIKGEMYYEIKSTRQTGGKVVCYDWRMTKEEDASVPLTYLIVCHALKGQRDDIVQAMADRDIVIYSVPAAIVHEAAKACPLQTMKRSDYHKRTGYARGEYRNGYRNLALKLLVEGCQWNDCSLDNSLGSGTVRLRTFFQRKEDDAQNNPDSLDRR